MRNLEFVNHRFQLPINILGSITLHTNFHYVWNPVSALEDENGNVTPRWCHYDDIIQYCLRMTIDKIIEYVEV